MKYGAFDSRLRILSILSIVIFGSLLGFAIISRATSSEAGPSSFSFSPEEISRLPSGTEPRDWKVIVIHHSETEDEPITAMSRRYIEMGFKSIPFHFIVHADGSIESTTAWKLQKPVSQTMDEKYFNTVSIGICVMGNFSDPGSQPSSTQMSGVILLTRHIMKTFRIKKAYVLPCRDIDDTLSPGENFPWRTFLYSIR
ncbi:N-acetylmuramoyl-L-alanine amidase [Planctomycetota bacterium]